MGPRRVLSVGVGSLLRWGTAASENALSIITLMGAAIPLQILVFNQLAIYCKARGYFAEKELQDVENATVPKDDSDHGSDHGSDHAL